MCARTLLFTSPGFVRGIFYFAFHVFLVSTPVHTGYSPLSEAKLTIFSFMILIHQA